MGNEGSSLSSSAEADTRVQPPTQVAVTIKWPHGARSASVCGTFNDWKQTAMTPSTAEPGTWVKVLELKAGVHQYKFIIDGQWKHDPAAPTVLDALGNINNFVTVKAQAAHPKAAVQQEAKVAVPAAKHARKGAADAHAAASHSHSSSTEALRRSRQCSDPYMHFDDKVQKYSQICPPKEDLLVQHAASMMLPPHLLLNLPHLAGDGSKPPVHVQLNHMFVHAEQPSVDVARQPSADEDVGAIVFSTCVRFKDAFVTSVLYKPRFSPVVRARNALGGLTTGSGAFLPESKRDGSFPREIRFLSVRIAETQTKHDEKLGRDYVAYEVETTLCVRGAQMTLRSTRRYTHFRLLDQMLRREFGAKGTYTASRLLPPKRTFGNFDAAFVQERRAALQEYLEACIESQPIANSPAFCHFIDSSAPTEEPSITRSDSNVLLERISAKQGYLLKQSSRKVSWKSRFFCLYDTELLYYYSEAVSNPFQPLNIVHVSGASVCRVALLSMARHFLFTVRTKQHEWWIAADSERTREEWLLALCNAGATLTTQTPELSDGGSVVGGSYADFDLANLGGGGGGGGAAAAGGTMPGEPSSSSLSAGNGSVRGSSESSAMLHASSSSGVDGGSFSGAGGLRGLLWKRPSKVHILHDLENEPSWVARHFQLIPTERLLVYVQDAADPIDDPQGILPLSNFGSVEEMHLPHTNRYAFKLCPPGAAREKEPPPTAPDDSPRVSRATSHDGAGDPQVACEAFIMLADTPEKRRDWMRQISMLLPRPSGSNSAS